jgi:hypothetical protein
MIVNDLHHACASNYYPGIITFSKPNHFGLFQ